MKMALAAVFASILLFSGCAGFHAARAFPREFSAAPIFSAPPEEVLKEVHFAPDHKRFLAFMKDTGGRTQVAGEASGKFAWAFYAGDNPSEGEPGPFHKNGGVSFVVKDESGYRMNHRGLLGGPWDEIAHVRHSETGVVYAGRNRQGWFLVQAVPGEGKLYEEPAGPFPEKPVFAVNGLFMAVMEPNGVINLEGPTFSIPFPLSFMQENLGLSIGIPNLMTAASTEGFCAVAAGSSDSIPGAVNAFAVTVKEDQGNQAGFSPFSGIDRMMGAPVFSADASRVAVVVEKEGRAHLVVADLKNPSFGIGPAFSGIKFPVFSPGGMEGACVVEENGKFRLLRGEKAESGLFDFMGRPVFSAGGEHLAVLAQRGGMWFAVIDGAEHGPVSCDRLENPSFAADGQSLVVNSVIGRHLYMVTITGG